MKRILFRALLFLALVATLALTLVSCQKDEAEPQDGVTYDDATLSKSIVPFSYEGLTVELSDPNTLKSAAIWAKLLAEVEILSYPEDAVEYYAKQRRDTYRYYAEKNDWSYEQALESFGVTEETILAEAREMVKGDLVYRYIVKDAGITISEDEKSAQWSRYVKKFAEDYGYTEDYVEENMQELICDSMLYDKTMEYLIVNNTFIEKQ